MVIETALGQPIIDYSTRIKAASIELTCLFLLWFIRIIFHKYLVFSCSSNIFMLWITCIFTLWVVKVHKIITVMHTIIKWLALRATRISIVRTPEVMLSTSIARLTTSQLGCSFRSRTTCLIRIARIACARRSIARRLRAVTNHKCGTHDRQCHYKALSRTHYDVQLLTAVSALGVVFISSALSVITIAAPLVLRVVLVYPHILVSMRILPARVHFLRCNRHCGS